MEDFFLISHNDTGTVILGTKFMAARLFESKTIMVDGTFKIAPTDFRQVYILWAVVEGTPDGEQVARYKAYPCIYIIMKSKKSEEYTAALREIEKYR